MASDYEMLIAQIKSLANISSDAIPVMANASSLLFYNLPEINWAGFYMVNGEELILGPFQGRLACVSIKKGRGVCGTAFYKDEVQLVPDVHDFPGHSACDAASNSEIVIPLHDKNGTIKAVLGAKSQSSADSSSSDSSGSGNGNSGGSWGGSYESPEDFFEQFDGGQ